MRQSSYLIGLITLAVTSLHGQSNQPRYWSVTAPNCTALGEQTPVTIKDSSGNTVGYSCFMSGTFVWLAAGGVWGTTIRVAAPAGGAIGVDYTFYDKNGNPQNLDATFDRDPRSLMSGNEVDFALFANQPVELELRGATTDAPTYQATAEGSVYAIFFCPDEPTCASLLPQLIYSALPTYPWSLSVPIAWDLDLASQWSAVGIDDGVTNIVSLVVYNEDTSPNSYTIDVYDSTGALFGSATTPSVAPLQPNSFEGGVYAALLSDLISPLPAGPFKILVDGKTALSAVEVLQIDGASATTLQVAQDTEPSTDALVSVRHKSNAKRSRVPSPRQVFPAVPRK